MPLSFSLNDDQKAFLLNSANLSIESTLLKKENVNPIEPNSHNEILMRYLGSFVTITMNGDLRGCIGNIIGKEPLWKNVWRMAKAAAFEDPRFNPITISEWSKCSLKISVLDELTICQDVEKIEIGVHGLALQFHGISGVFLPQVPVEQGWDRLEYLEHLCLKAGLNKDVWKDKDAVIYWYEAFVF